MLLGKKVEVRLPDGLTGIGQAKDLRLRLVDADEAALPVLEVDLVRNVIHKGVQQKPFVGQRFLGVLEVGDVNGGAREADGFPRGIAHRDAPRQEGAHGAIFAAQVADFPLVLGNFARQVRALASLVAARSSGCIMASIGSVPAGG